MRAKLRYLHSPDVADLRSYCPEDPHCFGILVQAMIGPAGEAGEEAFDFLVCTPRWLESTLADGEHQFGRHYLFVRRYSYTLLQQAIEKLCMHAEGPDWDTVAEILAGYGRWEFEHYLD